MRQLWKTHLLLRVRQNETVYPLEMPFDPSALMTGMLGSLAFAKTAEFLKKKPTKHDAPR